MKGIGEQDGRHAYSTQLVGDRSGYEGGRANGMSSRPSFVSVVDALSSNTWNISMRSHRCRVGTRPTIRSTGMLS